MAPRPALPCVLAVALLLALGGAPAHAAQPASPPPPGTHVLKPGEFLWMPELAPEGPVVIVISLPQQLAYVYRNGIRIAVSTISSGKDGHETPTGVFTILQKKREHYSNLYDNAPMPYMQRLTWDGIALHAGNLPGYPASHGCVRLPYKFSEKLFGITRTGVTVVVAGGEGHAPTIAAPGVFAPVDPATGAPRDPLTPLPVGATWAPERSPDGPITIILSLADREVVVLRNAVEIGRSRVEIDADALHGTHAYVLLEGDDLRPNPVLLDRPARRWLAIAVPEKAGKPEGDLHRAFAEGQVRVPEDFARAVDEVLVPGTTLVVTEEPLEAGARASGLTVLRADETEVTPPPPAP